MSESLSTFDKQVLEKICHAVLDKNPPINNTVTEKDIIYFKGVCTGLIQSRYNQYYSSVNMRGPSDKEMEYMVSIVNLRINRFFDNKTHT